MLSKPVPQNPDITERQVQFTRHFAENEGSLHAFAYSLVPHRADADDIIQETLKSLWKHFEDYDPERPFLPWANRFVYRQVQQHRRSQATRAKYFFSDETIERLAASTPASDERDHALCQALDTCLEKLNATHRELVEQRYLAKVSLRDFAERQNQTPNALYKKLQRLREILHDCITNQLAKEGFAP
ncbi:MAG: sigma-70 family RNA polymerase sigma factor [Verrucomicrobiota bacterium]